jgi:hypothetical protein
VTENDPIGIFYPKQITRAALYSYINKELIAIEPILGAPGFEYARADQAACWMLQARLYLNANIYNPKNTNSYDSCITAVNKVISSSKYNLAANYLQNFGGDNNYSPEIIFAFTSDSAYSQTYGAMDFVIHAAVGGSMNPASFGLISGWDGTRTTSALVDKFNAETAGDNRQQFWTDGQTEAIADYTNFLEGYGITKFTNVSRFSTENPIKTSLFVNTDFPVFRLPDAYLMYAEATLRGATTGSTSTALGYVNSILNRAYGVPTGGAWNVTSIDLQWILDERSRELYWEGVRRTDLIRFGQFSESSYVWPWKGNEPAGVSTDSHLNILPLPASEINANPNLKQNPGYQ